MLHRALRRASPAPDLTVNEILDVTIQNPHGLHLRPAALLIKTLSGFPAEVLIENRTASRGPILARSLVDVARLQIHEGDSVRFSISSADPKPVIDSIRSLVENQFGESAQPVPSKRSQWRDRMSLSLSAFRAESPSVVLFCWTPSQLRYRPTRWSPRRYHAGS